MNYKVQQSERVLHVDFENGPAFRAKFIKAWGRSYWVIEEWDDINGIYNYAGQEKTAKDAIEAIIIENQSI